MPITTTYIKDQKKLMGMLDFTNRTDRKNLKTQIRVLVSKGVEVANEELNKRRMKLKDLLDMEATQYENEFTQKVMSRIELGIKERREKLLTIDDQHKLAESDFKNRKVMQKQMNNDYDVRDAVARRMRMDTKLVLEEQILENERKKRREQELDQYWVSVARTNWDRMDREQAEENNMKANYMKQTNCVNRMQQLQHEADLQEERDQKKRDGEAVDAMLREAQIAELKAPRDPKAEFKRKYAEELLAMVKEKRDTERNWRENLADEHRKLIAELQRLEEADNLAMRQRKRDLHRSLVEYIAYMKRMRDLEDRRVEVEMEGRDMLYRFDTCMKKHKGQSAEAKAQALRKYYAELRNQVCQEYERRLREDAERREPGMTINPFDRMDTPRSVVLERRQVYRRELDEQLKMIAEVRKAEEAWLEARLPKLLDDPAVLADLQHRCEFKNEDYLPHHPFWPTLACDKGPYKNREYEHVVQTPCTGGISDWCEPTRNIPKVHKGGAVCPPWIKRCHL